MAVQHSVEELDAAGVDVPDLLPETSDTYAKVVTRVATCCAWIVTRAPGLRIPGIHLVPSIGADFHCFYFWSCCLVVLVHFFAVLSLTGCFPRVGEFIPMTVLKVANSWLVWLMAGITFGDVSCGVVGGAEEQFHFLFSGSAFREMQVLWPYMEENEVLPASNMAGIVMPPHAPWSALFLSSKTKIVMEWLS